MSHYNRSDEYIAKPKYGIRFTADDVRDLRDTQGFGMLQAKSILLRQQVLSDIKTINNGGFTQFTISDILEYLIEYNYITF